MRRAASARHGALRPLGIGAYVAALGGLLLLRRPDAATNPQFWAEDGAIFFAQAHNEGWRVIARPLDGYPQTLTRIVAEAAQPLGLSHGPALYSAVSLAIAVLPALVLVGMYGHLVRPLWARLALGVLVTLVPNFETHANLTNAHWHLALATVLMVVAPAPGRRARPWLLAMLLLSALSGPFVLALAPVAVLRWWWGRTSWHAVLAGISLLCAVLDVVTAPLSSSTRSNAPLGAGARLFARIVADRVVMPALGGRDAVVGSYPSNQPHGTALSVVLLGVAAVIVGLAVWKGPSELRLLLLFAGMVLGLALTHPMISETDPQWPFMVEQVAGDRYFLIPAVALMLATAWCLWRLPRAAALALGVALAGVFLGLAATSYQYAPYQDFNRDAWQARLDASPPGTVVLVPINPPGVRMAVQHR